MGPVRDEVRWQAVNDAVAETQPTDDPIDILDLGGGTGVASVRLAEAGHRVVVVDPSPDALASLHRRAIEQGVEQRIRAVQGDAADLADHVDAGSFDLVLCQGVLEHVDDYVEVVSVLPWALRAGGVASVVVAGRLAAVVSRAMAGDFAASKRLLEATAADWNVRDNGPRKFTREEMESFLTRAGLTLIRTDGLRTFVDHVPSAFVDAEPRAREALLDLERSVTRHFDLAAISTSLHSLARLD